MLTDRHRRVLFVDDDQDVLDGLRDGLRRRRLSWQLTFAASGAAALAEFDNGPVDVIVTDMRMPGMDGAALLSQVQARSPATVRIVLSGYADARAVAGAATGAHRFLAKPCPVEQLEALIERSFALTELSDAVEWYRGATGATSLPSCPGVYLELAAAIEDQAAGAERIADIVERDPAMAAKVLQLANSAFFGVGRHVSRVREAVLHLGTDTLCALALSARAFAELRPTIMPAGFSMEAFQRHASVVASIAATIVSDPEQRAEAVTAAVLHDIGVLVLLRDDPRRFVKHAEMARREELPLHVVELREQGVDHASVGGYLLALWGLPHPIAEAVASHHTPTLLAAPALDAVAAVHIADALAHEVDGRGGHPRPGLLDRDYVEELGLGAQIDGWRAFAAQSA